MHKKIAITSIYSVSSLGSGAAAVWKNYKNKNTLLFNQQIGSQSIPVGTLPDWEKNEILALKNSDSKYKELDNAVLFAIYVSRKAVQKANWSATDVFGINIGSSRGTTALFEKYHEQFLKTGKTPTLTSPTTTLGNISSWVGHDLQAQGPEISHSVTCSTALHALLNGVAWLRAGMSTKFLVGASEAPLTAFSIAQMQALKIYSKHVGDQYPCKALDLNKKTNTLVLGEGAAVACLELEEHATALCYIEGIGYANELLQHNISISDEAHCFQKSMAMALQGIDLKNVDVIVMHAPGTIKGDASEMKAIEKLFGTTLPLLTTNKWKIGHTFGASGMLSVEMAILMLQHQEFIAVPFIASKNVKKAIKKVLVNAVGFGGNAVSVLLSL